MANIEYSANKVKREQEAAQERGATGARIPPVGIVRAGEGIPVDLGPLHGSGAATLELLTSAKDSHWVIKGSLQPGQNVPLHSHDDVEDFYMLSGEAEALVETKNGLEWETVRQGDFIHIPGKMKHAWRNHFSTPAEQIIVTSAKLGRFLMELAELIKESGNNGAIEALLRLSERYGYWMASPAENAAVGISLP